MRIPKYPLAMPSANQSSRLSPVSAKDVFDEFKDKVKMIFDGGNSKHWYRVDCFRFDRERKILRPGFIQAKELSKFLKKRIYLDIKSQIY